MIEDKRIKEIFNSNCPLVDDGALNKQIVESLSVKQRFAYGEYIIHAVLVSVFMLAMYMTRVFDVIMYKVIDIFATSDITHTNYVLVLLAISLASSAICYGIYHRMSE